MYLPDTNGILFRIDQYPELTNESIVQSIAGIKFSNTYIGGGFFTGANHGKSATENDNSKAGTLHPGLNNQTAIAAEAYRAYTNENGAVLDLSTYYVPDPKDAVAIPLLIMSDSNDLIGAQTIALGRPVSSTGDLYYSTGEITYTLSTTYATTNDVAARMSGSGLIVKLDTDGDGEDEHHVVGTLATAYYGGTEADGINPGGTYRNANYTKFTPEVYRQLAEDMESFGVEADDVPRYILMSGFDQNSSLHEVNGTFLNENIIGGSWHDTLSGGGGDDIFTGGSGSDTFVFSDDDGDDVITDFAIGEDVFDGASLTTHDFEYKITESGLLVLYDNGTHSILFEGLTLSEVSSILPDAEYYMGLEGRDRWYDSYGDSTVYVGSFGGMVYAGLHEGSDHFDTLEFTNSKLTYRNATDGIVADYNNQIVTKLNGGVDTWEGNWLHIAGSNYDDIFYGTSSSELIWTWSGGDQVYSGGGDDRIVLHSGAKIIDGGDGYDSITLRSGSDDMYIYAESDPRHTDGMSSFSNVEYVDAFKTSNNIYLGSDTGVKILNASRGNDKLYIYANSVGLIGGSGSDTFNINPNNLLTSTADIVVKDFTALDTLIILGCEIDLDSSNDLPDGMSLESNDDGYLQIMFGDNDSVTLSNVMADNLI